MSTSIDDRVIRVLSHDHHHITIVELRPRQYYSCARVRHRSQPLEYPTAASPPYGPADRISRPSTPGVSFSIPYTFRAPALTAAQLQAMAGSDPRRSSRARTSQSQSQISSTTSSTSGRGERSTRYFNKAVSPQKSSSSGSLSSEAPDEIITADDSFGTRRRTRGQQEERDRANNKSEQVEMAHGDDDAQDEDEAVRCICGYEDYPGPPPLDEDSKDAMDIDPIFATDVTDDAAGFFVQCDVCKVWQHGACVGIMTEESSPEEYYCEECKKEFHKIFTASNG